MGTRCTFLAEGRLGIPATSRGLVALAPVPGWVAIRRVNRRSSVMPDGPSTKDYRREWPGRGLSAHREDSGQRLLEMREEGGTLTGAWGPDRRTSLAAEGARVRASAAGVAVPVIIGDQASAANC